jgi:hypothetical protein
MGDLSPQEQSTSIAMLSDQTRQAKKLTRKVADMPNQQRLAGKKVPATMATKAQKAKEAQRDTVNKPFRMDEAVEARVRNVHEAATTYRAPEETIGGLGFYFDHRQQTDEAIAGTKTPLRPALDAASKLSVRTKPEQEKQSLKALVSAHETGLVHFHPKLVSALSNLSKETTKGQSQPAIAGPAKTELHGYEGQAVRFSEIHPDIASHLTHPDVRELAKRHVSDVDLDGLSKSSMRKNVAEAHAVLQSGVGSSPYKNPKQFSYASAHEVSTPGTPEHAEYLDRFRKIAEISQRGNYQESFDLDGLRKSNAGVLSNEASTAEDTWQRRMSFNQPGKAHTSITDAINFPGKSRVTPSGKKQSVGMGDAKITPGGIEHAIHQEATHRAAKHIEKSLNLDFTVPAIGVQEVGWAADRRREGADSDYSAKMRGTHPNKGQQFVAHPTARTLFNDV